MNVKEWLEKNKQQLSIWSQKDKFMADFETLSEKNLQVKKGIKYSQVYLWGIYSDKMKYFLWGTEINDFIETIFLLLKNRTTRKRYFTFYFNNLGWDWEFMKHFFIKKDNVCDDFKKWKEIKRLYFSKKKKNRKYTKKYEGWVNLVKSGFNVISAQILKNGCVLNFKCSYKATNLSVKNMGIILEKEEIMTDKKLSDKFDYDLVDKVYSRQEFFEKIYGKINYQNNFFISDVALLNSPFQWFIKYLENDLKIPFNYLKYNRNVIKLINQKLDVKEKKENILQLDKKWYLILRKLKKGEKKPDGKNIKKTFLQKVKFIKIGDRINGKAYTKIRDHRQSQGWKIRVFEALNLETWLTKYEIHSLKNLGCEFEFGIKEWYELKRVEDIIPLDSLTVASKAFNGWKNYYGKENFKKEFGEEGSNVLSEREFDIVNRSFCGGLTNYNQENMGWEKEKWDVVSFDLNSSYPYEMLKNLPYGKPLKKKPKEGNFVSFSEYEIFEFKPKKEWENKFPPLFPTWKTMYKQRDQIKQFDYLNMPSYVYNWNKKYGSFQAVFDGEEWELINKFYDIKFKKIETIYFKTKEILKDYINALKQIKLNAKSKPERDYGKLMMNSIYGKTAQNLFLDTEIILERQEIPIDALSELNNQFTLKDRKTGQDTKLLSDYKYIKLLEISKYPKVVLEKNFSFLTYYGIDRNLFSLKINKKLGDEYLQCRQIGSIITSRARINLVNTMIKIGWKNVKYFDTDSIYFYWNNETKKAIKKIEIDNHKLGAWCWEKKMKKMKILGPKKYQLQIIAEWNGKEWEEKKWIDYRVAGLKNARANFERVGHKNFKDGYILKGVNVKKQVLDSGVILNDPVDYELEKKYYKNF